MAYFRPVFLDQEQRSLPFELVLTSNSQGRSVIKVTPGTIAGILPSNIFDDFQYTAGSDLYIWAQCTASQGIITAVALSAGGSNPVPQSINEGFAPPMLKIPIGMYKGSTGSTFNFIGANWLTPYATLAYTTQDQAGNVKNYYYWRW
jgi:hypothetical protein